MRRPARGAQDPRMRATRPEPTHLADVGGLRRAGAWFLAASVLWWIAAAALIPPDDYFFNESARDEALSIAAHAGMFRAFHVVATAGIAAGVVGMIVLARSLRSRERSRVVDTAAGCGHRRVGGLGGRGGHPRHRRCGQRPRRRRRHPHPGIRARRRQLARVRCSPRSASRCRWFARGSWPADGSPGAARHSRPPLC